MPDDLTPTLTVTIDADTRPLEAQLAEVSKAGARFSNALSQSFVDLALKGRSIGDVLAGLVGGAAFARGGVIRQGLPVPFAQGGVIASPIAFPLAGNRLGLAGERGPEAILPLARGSDGRLGV